MYAWVKSLHVIFMVTWFAGLFYLPRLFVYHASAEDLISLERFKTMERKLYFGITTPGGVLTLLFGFWLVYLRGTQWAVTTPWFLVKLGLIALLIGYHIYLGYLLNRFKRDLNRHSHVFYRWINELPVLVLIAVVVLAIVKPQF